MRDGLEVVHASIEDFATTYRAWLTLAPAYSYAPALLPSVDAAQYLPDAETLARAYCPIAGPRWDEHRERMLASTSLKGLTVLRSQVESELTALERLAAERGNWDQPHPYSNGTHHIRFWEEILRVAFTRGPVVSIQDRFAFSMSAALRRKNKMRKPRGQNVNSQSVKVDVVANNGDSWTRMYIVKPERLRQEFREAESYMVDEQDSSMDSDSEGGDSFHEHRHTPQCSTAAASIAWDVAAQKCSLTKLIHELRAAADTEASARVKRSEEDGRSLPLVPIRVEIVVTRMQLQEPSQPLPSVDAQDAQEALAAFYQMPEWDRFNHRLAAIVQEAERHNVDMVFGYRSLPVHLAAQPPSGGLTAHGNMALPKIAQAPSKPHWRTTSKINLDVTAMIALVSDTTHGVFGEGTASTTLDESMRHPKIEDAECGSGAKYQHHFRTFSIRKEALEARAAELSLHDDAHDDAHDEAARALDHAAAKEGRALAIQLERELNIETLFDAILGPIWGNGAKPRQPVELFATVGAFDRLRRVSATVGGPNEKRRVKALLGEPGCDPQDFWTGSKWDAPEHEQLRRCVVLPVQALQDLGPGGFESLARLKQVYPDLPRAHFISHMVDTLESCLSELWGADWRDISEDLPRSKYKKLRQSTVHQAGGQTYTTLRSMHACARYGMTTLTSNMDSVQWLLKEMSRRPYSDQTKQLLRDATSKELEEIRAQQSEFVACFIVLHPRSLSEQMRVTTEAPAWREVLDGYPADTDAKQPSKSNGHAHVEVQGYTIHDSDDRIASSHGVAFSVDAIALARHGETYDSSLHASSHQSDSMGASQPDTVKKPSPMTPLSLQPEIEPIYYAEHAEHEQPASAVRRGVADRVRAFVLGPHPPKHLSIRHYRWWPLARVERAWIRLTDPLAWKQPPETTYGFGGGDEMDPHLPPGLAWWRSVTADFKFNKLHWIALVAVYVGWILGFAFLAKALWYESSLTIDGVESTPAFLSCTSTYWLRNGECGIDGEACAPFYTPTAEAGQPFRCPAQCVDVTLLNPRAVGSELANYQPLVVGGGDANRTYRGDSFICAAAIHAGVIRNERGGCGSVRLVGAHAGFDASTAHGIESIGFDAAFPVAYRFEAVQGQTDCTDRRWQGYVFNALMTAVVGFVLRPKRIVWFWTLACVGFWHITLVSEPRDYPPPIGAAVGDFLPFLFVCYAIWRLAFRFVWPAFSHLPLESTLWTLGFWWLGVLLNVVFDKVPLQRLVARDIRQQPGSLVALIVIVVVVLAIAVNQVRVMRATGELPKYLSLYALGGVGVGLAAAVPGETLRLHHYIIALVLLPACAFPTRLGLVYIAFLLGMYTNGIARWGFDGLLQDNAVVQGDATGGTARPSFNTTPQDWARSEGVVRWNAFEDGGWDGYQLLVDDVLRYEGAQTSFNLMSVVDRMVQQIEADGQPLDTAPSNETMSAKHYVRVAFSAAGSPGDFTRAAVALANGTWIPAPSGAT
jgi:hypothetical protein